MREFLHVDDLADACLFLMQNYDKAGHINVGTGSDISIMDLANLVREITGFNGKIVCDVTKPNGTPRKLLDVQKMTELGWQSRIELSEGIKQVYSEAFNQ